jgi:hypothetical protein
MKKFELVFVLSARDRNMTDEFLFLHQQTSNNIKRKKSEHREQKRKYTHIQSTRKRTPRFMYIRLRMFSVVKKIECCTNVKKQKKSLFFIRRNLVSLMRTKNRDSIDEKNKMKIFYKLKDI